jgi:carboxyl-terminal processing protease
MKRIAFILFVAVSLFYSCHKEKSETPVDNLDARDSLYYIMNYWYYWYKEMPVVNKDDYNDPYSLLEGMRYKARDLWSYVSVYEEYNDRVEGYYTGFGAAFGREYLSNALIWTVLYVYNESDLYKQGVRRGWKLVSVNGNETSRMEDNEVNALLASSSAKIVFAKQDGTKVTVSAKRKRFLTNTILNCDTLHLSSGVTGYLAYKSFYLNSIEEFKEAFSYLSQCGVTDLIVDLRYNGGGRLSVAQELASYIIGNDYSDKAFNNIINNDLKSKWDTTYNFIKTDYPLNLKRVVFITTWNSASASECVINGLKPYIDVTLVGKRTMGKPCGMYAFNYKDQYAFAPISFEGTNANNEGGYYDGIPADISSDDDWTHDFGDRKESCLAAAIEYLESGTKKKSAVEETSKKTVFLGEDEELYSLFVDLPVSK